MSVSSSDICNRLYRLAREQGGRNVEIELNSVPVLVIQRAEDADHVLRLNAANYLKNMAWFRQTLGASRFSEDGEAWRLRKELTQVYFTKFDRENTFRLACRHARRALARLAADSAAGADCMRDDVLREMAASVLIENFFGIALDETDVDLRTLAELMEYGSEYSFVPAGRTQALYRERLAQLPALRRRVLHELRQFRDGGVPANPMLAGMRAADADPATGVVLEHELLTFFAAGAETTAATMGWACHLLATHPAVQERLHALAAAFWRQPASRHDGAHLAQVEAISAFLSETLRLYPPTPIVARLAVAADRIGERAIAPGHNVLLSFVGIQHDPRLRADPWALDLDGDPTRRSGAGSGIGTAFSFGPRVCGGKHFALVELAAFLAVFLAQARFEPSSGEAPVFHWKSQMLREGGQRVRVRLRDDAAAAMSAAEAVTR